MLLRMALFHSFTSLSNISLYVCGITPPRLLCLVTCRWTFGLLCVWAVAAGSAVSPGCMSLSYFSLDVRLGMGLQSHVVALVLVSSGASTLFPIVAAPGYSPTNTGGRVLFSPLRYSLCIDFSSLFRDDHCDWWEVVLYHSFDVHFL